MAATSMSWPVSARAADARRCTEQVPLSRVGPVAGFAAMKNFLGPEFISKKRADCRDDGALLFRFDRRMERGARDHCSGMTLMQVSRN